MKKWAEEAWNGRTRRGHLYKTATRINMREGKLTAEQYFSKLQEYLRLSGNHTRIEVKIKTLKDNPQAILADKTSAVVESIAVALTSMVSFLLNFIGFTLGLAILGISSV